MTAAGFVLTGGNSTRMGRDKALLTVDDRPLVEKIAAVVGSVSEPVILVGRPDRYRTLSYLCLPDRRPNLGPLSGIETALEQTTSDLNLIVACDMPGLERIWLVKLVNYARTSHASCVVTRDRDGHVHPLCAVYRKRCLSTVSAALEAGRLRLTAVVEELGADYLDTDGGLENVNTPLDWAKWQASHR